MSNVWEVEASNVDIAVLALRLWGGYSEIPIVNYSGEEQSKFMNLLGATEKTAEVVGRFIADNKEAIRNSIESIKDVEPEL
jgi:hypothetical protein